MNETRTGSDAAPAGGTAPQVTLITTAGCHFCADARSHLEELQEQGRVTLTLMGADSPAGGRLVAEHRPAMFPLVLVDGRYFSGGRLPRIKLQRLLAQAGR